FWQTAAARIRCRLVMPTREPVARERIARERIAPAQATLDPALRERIAPVPLESEAEVVRHAQPLTAVLHSAWQTMNARTAAWAVRPAAACDTPMACAAGRSSRAPLAPVVQVVRAARVPAGKRRAARSANCV